MHCRVPWVGVECRLLSVYAEREEDAVGYERRWRQRQGPRPGRGITSKIDDQSDDPNFSHLQGLCSSLGLLLGVGGIGADST